MDELSKVVLELVEYLCITEKLNEEEAILVVIGEIAPKTTNSMRVLEATQRLIATR